MKRGLDSVALGALLVLAAVVVWNVRQGTMGQWFRAKFLGEGSTPPAGKRYATAGGGNALGQAGNAVTGSGAITPVAGISGGVAASIAAQVTQMISAAARDGITLTGGGWRSSAGQQALRDQNCGVDYPPDGPAEGCNPPTAPVGQSQHQLGLAIDFDNSRTRQTAVYQWLATNAATYGLRNLPSEPWHWSTTGR